MPAQQKICLQWSIKIKFTSHFVIDEAAVACRVHPCTARHASWAVAKCRYGAHYLYFTALPVKAAVQNQFEAFSIYYVHMRNYTVPSGKHTHECSSCQQLTRRPLLTRMISCPIVDVAYWYKHFKSQLPTIACCPPHLPFRPNQHCFVGVGDQNCAIRWWSLAGRVPSSNNLWK